MKDKIVKVTLIGDTQAGKTSVVESYQDVRFNATQKPSIGADFSVVPLKDNENIKLQIWHMGGDKKFASMATAFFPGTEVFIFVVDGEKPLSIKEKINIQERLTAARLGSSEAKFYIAVNKSDSDKLHSDFLDQKTAAGELKKIAQHAGITDLADDAIIFCSAKTKQNVNELFDKVGADYVNRHELNKDEDKDEEFDIPKGGLETHEKVWIGGNGLVAAGGVALFVLAAFAVGSFLTFGILPSAFIGAAIITGAALLAWNVGCAIYHEYVKDDDSMGPIVNIDEIDDSSFMESYTEGLGHGPKPEPKSTFTTQVISQPGSPRGSSSTQATSSEGQREEKGKGSSITPTLTSSGTDDVDN